MDSIYAINKLRAGFLKASSDGANARILAPYRLSEIQTDEAFCSQIKQLYFDKDKDIDYLTYIKSPPIDDNYFVVLVQEDPSEGADRPTDSLSLNDQSQLSMDEHVLEYDDGNSSLHSTADGKDVDNNFHRKVSLLSAGSSSVKTRRPSATSTQSSMNLRDDATIHTKKSKNYSTSSLRNFDSTANGDRKSLTNKKGRIKSKLSRLSLSKIFKHDSKHNSSNGDVQFSVHPDDYHDRQHLDNDNAPTKYRIRSSSLQHSGGKELEFYDRTDNIFEDEDDDDDEDEDEDDEDDVDAAGFDGIGKSNFRKGKSKASHGSLSVRNESTTTNALNNHSRIPSGSYIDEQSLHSVNNMKSGTSSSIRMGQSLKNFPDGETMIKQSLSSLSSQAETKNTKKPAIIKGLGALNPIGNGINVATKSNGNTSNPLSFSEHYGSLRQGSNVELLNQNKEDDSFDIDSFVNEDALGQLDLDNVNTLAQEHKIYDTIAEDKLNSSLDSSFASVQHNKKMFETHEKRQQMSDTLNENQANYYNDLASSYDDSLMDSDLEYTQDQYVSKNDSKMLGHSIPSSKDIYDNKLATERFGSMSTYQSKYLPTAEKSLANHKRTSSNESKMGFSKVHQLKPTMPKDSKDRLQHSGSFVKKGFSQLSSSSFDSERHIDPISFAKKTSVASNAHSSQLTSMFRVTDENDKTKLSHFQYVSASQVQPKDRTSLLVYIQDYNKYKHDGFVVKVRKDATVYETINYILFCFVTMEKLSPEKNNYSNPNEFTLRIVDEDGEPFEDNFGILDRETKIGSIFDEEVVLCRIHDKAQIAKNASTAPDFGFAKSKETPLLNTPGVPPVQQLAYYKSLTSGMGNPEPMQNSAIDIKVYKYPFVESAMINSTTITVLMTSKINDILTKYCKLKNLDPTEFYVKKFKDNYFYDLKDNIISLDGQKQVEIISRKEGRQMRLTKYSSDNSQNRSVLPTIQSNEAAPFTLNTDGNFLPVGDITTKLKKSSIQQDGAKWGSSAVQKNTGNSFLYKIKNSSKTSIQHEGSSAGPASGGGNSSSSKNFLFTPTSYAQNKNFLSTDAYFKYTVYRRQQKSLIGNKHERTLAIDGEYVYIIPPDDEHHWYEHHSIKTKSFHVSQIILVKKSNKNDLYFKIIISKQQVRKTYYFEALNAEERSEIVEKLQKLTSVYNMNH